MIFSKEKQHRQVTSWRRTHNWEKKRMILRKINRMLDYLKSSDGNDVRDSFRQKDTQISLKIVICEDFLVLNLIYDWTQIEGCRVLENTSRYDKMCATATLFFQLNFNIMWSNVQWYWTSHLWSTGPMPSRIERVNSDINKTHFVLSMHKK